MASEDDPRIVQQLSRLAGALQLLLQHPSFDRQYELEARILLDRVFATLQHSDDLETLIKLVWVELRPEVLSFLQRVTFASIPQADLRSIINYVNDVDVQYFFTPETNEDDLKREIWGTVYSPQLAGGNGEEKNRQLGSRPAPEEAAPSSGVSYGDREGVTRAVPPEAAPAPSLESVMQKPVTRVVNTGFSDRGLPEVNVPSSQSLRANTAYWFWVEIGEPQSGSIEVTPTVLPGFIPTGAVLTVAVFALKDELILDDDADIGTVRLTGGTGSEVVDQPGIFEYLFVKNPIRKSRLFFPVKTPSHPGAHRLRCNIYYQHVVVQSRIVTAWVGPTPEGTRALRSVLDYKLSHSLDPGRLARMGSNTLSVFVNENADGGHGFYFEGQQQVKTQASLDAQMLQDSLTQVRRTLRTVAWGSPDPWQKSFQYRYGSGGEPDFFASDLTDLAIRGYMLYSALIDQISGGPRESEKLAALMAKPGKVQISSKESARFVVPAALFYDRPLDTQLKQYRLCDAFLQTLRARADLAAAPCFQGACPHLGELDAVCPSGFWGYRHELGLPVSIELESVGEAEPDIEFNDPAAMLVIVSLDKMFTEREPHEMQLRKSRTQLSFLLCDGRAQALTALKNPQAQMIYFYCHGGTTANNTPYLNIGNEEYITPDNLRAYRIRWKSPRPLVFLNGCMTTALEPEKAIEFVSAFVNQAAASGVIGTEITVFEPLATEFAEAFMKHFMGECKPIGLSIKLARLALLQRFNPLGLVYIPFALPGLHLVDLSGASH